MATQLCACSSLLRLFCVVVVGIIFVATFNEKRALNFCFFLSFRFGYFELEQRLHNFDIVDDGSGNVNTFFKPNGEPFAGGAIYEMYFEMLYE